MPSQSLLERIECIMIDNSGIGDEMFFMDRKKAAIDILKLLQTEFGYPVPETSNLKTSNL